MAEPHDWSHLPPGHWGSVNSVAWSPKQELLATASSDGTVRIWKIDEEKTIALLPHGTVVNDVSWSPDGAGIASAGAGGVRVWDATTGEKVQHLKGWVSCVAWSPGGARIAGAGRDGVSVWNATTGEEVRHLRGHSGGIQGVAWSPDGARIAGAGRDGVSVWDATTGEKVQHLKGRISSVAWSPDGARIAGAGAGGARVWDATTGEKVRHFREYQGGIWDVAWSPDGQRLASAGDNGRMRVWDATTGETVQHLQGRQGRVLSVAWSPQGDHIASGGELGVQVWDAAIGNQVHVLQAHQDEVLCVAWSPQGDRIASGGERGLQVWNAATGNEENVLGRPNVLQGVAWSPSGHHIAGAGNDGLRVWDAATREEVQHLPSHEGGAVNVAWSPEGDRIASAGSDGVRVWDGATGEEVQHLPSHKGGALDVAWSPQGDRIAIAEDDGVRVWDAATGHEVQHLKGYNRWVRGVSWSPKGDRIASAERDEGVRVWDATTGEEVQHFRGHKGGAMNVAWSPQGHLIASAGTDGVRVWDATTGEEVQHLQGHKGGVYRVVWSPLGDRIASAGRDGTMRVWDLEGRTVLVFLPGWGWGGLDGTKAPFRATKKGAPIYGSSAYGFTAYGSSSDSSSDPNEQDDPEPATTAPNPSAADDRPLDDPNKDRLDSCHYAAAIHHVLTHKSTRFPLTVAVNAPWGTGKSTIAQFLKRKLEDDDYVVCEFNAWMHDDKDALTPAFVRAVARTADRERPRWRRILWPLPRHLWETRDTARHVGLWSLRLLALFAPLALLLWTFLWAAGLDERKWAELVYAGGSAGLTLVATALATAWRRLRAFIQDPAAAERAGDIPAVRRDVKRLVAAATGLPYPWHRSGPVVADDEKRKRRKERDPNGGRSKTESQKRRPPVAVPAMQFVAGTAILAWAPAGWLAVAAWLATVTAGGLLVHGAATKQAQSEARLPEERRPLVVFVDDLERCRPPRAVDVLEAIEQLFTSSNVAVVLLADMSMVASNVQVKYDQLATLHRPSGVAEADEKAASRLFGRQYVQKMVQLQLDVPRVARPYTRNLLASELMLTVGEESYKEHQEAKARKEPGQEPLHLDPPQRIIHDETAGQEPVPPEPHEPKEEFDAENESASESSMSEEEEAEPKQHLESEPEAVRAVVEDPRLLLNAAAAAEEWLPGTPRSTKRVLNRIRLTLYLCAVRGLLPGKVTPEDVGLWCVLCERWPDLATVLQHAPATAKRIRKHIQGTSDDEEALRKGEEALRKELKHLVPLYAAEADLRQFWHQESAQHLAECVPNLVAFHTNPGPEFDEEAPPDSTEEEASLLVMVTLNPAPDDASDGESQ